MVLLIGAGQSLRREAVADAEGRYEFTGLPAGQYSLWASPRGWYVKAVRYRDRDVTDVPTEFRASTDPSALEVVMSTRGAMLSGRVLDEIGNTVTGVRVVIFSAARARWNDQRLTVVAVSKEGTYQIGPLRGGEYFVVALDPSAVPPQPSSRSELAPLAETAERITLSGEGQQTMDLRLVKRE